MRIGVKEGSACDLFLSRRLEHATMIQPALCLPRHRPPEALDYLHGLVDELKTNGFVAESLRRSNRVDATWPRPAEFRLGAPGLLPS